MSPITEFKRVFDKGLPHFEQHFKLKADYTPDSLQLLEATLDTMYPRGTMARNTTLLSTGYYVGEVFVRNIPGSIWNYTLVKDDPFVVTVDYTHEGVAGALMVQPSHMVYDYITHPANSISRLFQYYKEVSEGKRDIKDTLPGTDFTIYKETQDAN